MIVVAVIFVFISISVLWIRYCNKKDLAECKLNEGAIYEILDRIYDYDENWKIRTVSSIDIYSLRDSITIRVSVFDDVIEFITPFNLRLKGKYKKQIKEALAQLKLNYLIKNRQRDFAKKGRVDFICEMVEEFGNKASIIIKKAKADGREDVVKYWEGVEFACTKFLRSIK